MKKKLLQGLIIAFVALVLALIAGDLVLQYFHHQQQARWVSSVSSFYPWETYSSAEKKISHRPGYIKVKLQPGVVYDFVPNQKTEHFSINSQGFRGPEIKEKTEDKKRVVVIGGSTAFGTGLNSDDETFAVQLEQLIPDIEVINASVIGYMSGQELALVISKIIDLEPDLVIALNGANDLGGQIHRGLPKYRLGFRAFGKLEDQLQDHYFLTSTNFFTRAKNSFINLFFPATKRFLYELEQDTLAKQSLEVALIANEYIANMLKMEKILKAYDAQFLCLLQPDTRVVNGTGSSSKVLAQQQKSEEQTEKYIEFLQLVKKAFDNSKLFYIDLNKKSNDIKADMFMDFIHLNASGNKAMVRIAAPYVKSIFLNQ